MATFEYVKIGDGVTTFDNLPYVAGYPGATGPQGIQGDQGNAGTSGGLTFQLDYASVSTYSYPTTLTGDLLTTFSPGASGTSINILSTQSAAKIASFSIPTSSLPGQIAVTNLWDLNLYASATTPSSQAVFWFDVYDGGTQIATGSISAATQVTATNADPQLFTYTLLVPGNTYGSHGGSPPKLIVNVYAQTGSTDMTFYFRQSRLSHLHTSLVAVGSIGPTGVQGPTGFQGVTGPTGPQGFTGPTGPTGVQGVTGPQGFQGVTGPQGFQGVTGPQGFQGVTGPQGFQGVTGPQGFQA
jgi:hypothetical protein